MVISLILSVEAAAARDAAPDRLPREPAISFKTIGQSVPANGGAFVTQPDGNARAASISITKSWLRVRNAPEAFRLNVLWRAGRFGRVVLEADGGGKGYNLGGPKYYLLNSELARTQASKLAARLAKMEKDGPALSPELLARCRTALEAASRVEQGRTELERAGLADAALELLPFANEDLVLEQARRDIERFRKGNAQIVVEDADGRPIPNAEVRVEQVSRDFLTGFNAMGGYAVFRDKFVGIFNYATLAFYLGGLAPERGKYRWEPAEGDARWAAEHGIKTKGHPLTWFDGRTPDYLKRMDWDETVKFCLENARLNVAHFKGLIDAWDIINEAHGWANGNWSQAQLDDLTDQLAREVRAANPDALIVVNSCLPLGMYVQWKREPVSTPYEYYDRLNEMGTPYDVVGLQMYNGIESPFPTVDIARMSEILDRYSTLGKPIHVTEFSVSSDADEWGSWHGDRWDEQTQAEYVRAFYTLAFSKPSAKAITWWCPFDGQNWVANTGLLRKDLSEKPAYHALKELISGWTTHANGVTDAEGRFSFRGFHGEYEVKVTVGEREQSAKLPLHGERATVRITW